MLSTAEGERRTFDLPEEENSVSSSEMAFSLTISVVPIYLMFLMLWARVNSHDLSEERVKELTRKFCENEDGLWNITIGCINSLPRIILIAIVDCAKEAGMPDCETLEDMMRASCNDESELVVQENDMEKCMERQVESMQQELGQLNADVLNRIFEACQSFIGYCIANDLVSSENSLNRKRK